jgi:hypothetical protein
LTAAELVGYPGQFPGITLLNWETGARNARYWVTKLLRMHCGPGDRIVAFEQPSDLQRAEQATKIDYSFQVYAQPFVTSRGTREILLVNKRDRPVDVRIPGAMGGREQHVDSSTKSLDAPRPLASETLRLPSIRRRCSDDASMTCEQFVKTVRGPGSHGPSKMAVSGINHPVSSRNDCITLSEYKPRTSRRSLSISRRLGGGMRPC